MKSPGRCKERGFTLIELLVVIAIVSLLASVVISSLNSARDKGRVGAMKYFAAQVDHIGSDQAVGMWDFDDCSGTTAADRSGNGNNASLQSGATFSSTITPFATGCSLLLDGSNDYALINQPLTSNSPFTISMWFYPERINPSYDMLYSGTDNIDLQIFFHATTKKLTTSIENDEKTDSFGLTAGNINQWHHVVWTYDYSRRKVYIDGILDLDVANSTGLTIDDTQVRIGETLGGAYPFQGKIDNLHIFSKVLTAAEVGKLYASEAPAHKLAYKAL